MGDENGFLGMLIIPHFKEGEPYSLLIKKEFVIKCLKEIMKGDEADGFEKKNYWINY